MSSFQNLKIVYPENFPPWVIPYRDGDGRIRLHGIFGSMFGNLTQSLNMTYEAIPPNDGQYGSYLPDGTFDGQLQMALTGLVDIALGPFTAHTAIFESMHITPSYDATITMILSGMVEAFETKPVPYTRAFDNHTWLAVMSSIAVLTVLLIVEERVILGRKITFSSAFNDFFIVLQTLLQEATKKRFVRGCMRIVGAAWLLASFVLLQFFTCDLKANSVVKSPTLRLNNIQDLIAHRKTYKLIYPEKSPIDILLRSFPGELGKTFNSMLDEGFGVKSAEIYNEDNLELIRRSRAVLFMEDKSLSFRVSLYCEEKTHFYYLASDSFPWMPASFIIGPHVNKSLIAEMDRKIQWMFAMQVPFMRGKELIPGNMDCLAPATNRRADTADALSFSDVKFSFIAHMTILMACNVVLVVELVWSRYLETVVRRTKSAPTSLENVQTRWLTWASQSE